jgi:hypothetical protein
LKVVDITRALGSIYRDKERSNHRMKCSLGS